MKTDLTMDDDQLARFISLLSDKYERDTWQSLSEMVINAGLHALETMDDEKDNHLEERGVHREKLLYVCGRCQHTSCHLTVESSVIYPDTQIRQVVESECPLKWRGTIGFQLVAEPGRFIPGKGVKFALGGGEE